MPLVVLAMLACLGPAVTDSDTVDTDPEITGGAPVSDVDDRTHDVRTAVEVGWTQDRFAEAAWLEVTDADGRVHETPRLANVEPGEHAQLVLGTPPGQEFRYVVYNEIDGEVYASEQVFTATSQQAPGGLPLPEVLVHDPALASAHPWWLVSLDITDEDWYDGPFWLFIVDRQGRIVWYWAVPRQRASMFPRVAHDGSHLVFDAVTTYSKWDHGAESSFHRLSLDLSWHQEIATPYHTYAWDEDEDGRLLFDVVDPEAYHEYSLVRLGPEGGRTTLWRCRDDFPWGCAPNAIRWDTQRQSVLWSMYESDTVAEVDGRTGEVVHKWGDLSPFWRFDPPEAAFDDQHFPGFTPEGHLLAFTDVPGTGHTEQRVREYEIDEEARMLREVWSYGEGVDGHARYAGEATRLANGNTLVVYGSDGFLREVTPEGETAWELHWPEDRLMGHAEPIDDLYALARGPVP